MPQRESYVEGTPNWVDLQSTDQAASKEFYAAIFGWEYDDSPMGEGDEAAVYSMAKKGGGYVGAITHQPAHLAAAGAPPMWNTYLAVDDVDAAAGRVTESGGTI